MLQVSNPLKWPCFVCLHVFGDHPVSEFRLMKILRVQRNTGQFVSDLVGNPVDRLHVPLIAAHITFFITVTCPRYPAVPLSMRGLSAARHIRFTWFLAAERMIENYVLKEHVHDIISNSHTLDFKGRYETNMVKIGFLNTGAIIFFCQ